MPRVLITGSKGMLGSDVVSECENVFGAENVAGFSHQELDITSLQSIQFAFQAIKPNVVINCAAYTNVDAAELNQTEAREINFNGPKILAEFCHRAGSKLIHFSTDQVFDGTADHPWSETDQPNTLNHYALTKYEGEKAVLQFGNHVVLRVQWLYGQKKERFSQLKDKKIFTPFSDQWGAPTWTRDVARVLPKIFNSEGLFHFAYDDSASWAEVFLFVKEREGLSVILEPQKTAQMKLPAKRPLYCVLSNEKLKKELNTRTLGSWKVALAEFLGARHS